MTKVLVLYESEQNGYGKDLKVFWNAGGLGDYLRESLEREVVTHTEHRRSDMRTAAREIVAGAEAAMAVVSDYPESGWEFNGDEEQYAMFEGMRFSAKWCTVTE